MNAVCLLLSKLHLDNKRLFQRARTGRMCEETTMWFTNQPLGHNLLGSMMDRLSSHASLSKHYTSHRVQATAVHALKSAGVDDRTVSQVTGHKSKRSLMNFDKVTWK